MRVIRNQQQQRQQQQQRPRLATNLTCCLHFCCQSIQQRQQISKCSRGHPHRAQHHGIQQGAAQLTALLRVRQQQQTDSMSATTHVWENLAADTACLAQTCLESVCVDFALWQSKPSQPHVYSKALILVGDTRKRKAVLGTCTVDYSLQVTTIQEQDKCWLQSASADAHD